MKTFKTAVQLVSVLFGVFLFWVYSHSESYCFFYPSIDTYYAPGYSEDAFGHVTTGMTHQSVQRLLGSPLHSHTNKDASVRWCYTGDGKSIWGDWAWFGREVIFRENHVVEVQKIVYND